MSESRVTLGELLNVQGDAIQTAIEEHLEANPAQRSLLGAVLAMVAEDGARAVAKQLDLDLYELLFKAWAAVDELREYADPARHPPAERAIVRWGKCSIKAPQAVDIKLSVAGVTLPVLRLTVDLAADFHSLAISIQGGAIRKLTPGPALASVALRYRNTTLIAPRKTPEVKFERGIEFPGGLKIAWAERVN